MHNDAADTGIGGGPPGGLPAYHEKIVLETHRPIPNAPCKVCLYLYIYPRKITQINVGKYSSTIGEHLGQNDLGIPSSVENPW